MNKKACAERSAYGTHSACSEEGLRGRPATWRPAIPAATCPPLVAAPIASLRPVAPLVAALLAAAVPALLAATIAALPGAATPLVATAAAVAALAATSALVGAVLCPVAGAIALQNWDSLGEGNDVQFPRNFKWTQNYG